MKPSIRSAGAVLFFLIAMPSSAVAQGGNGAKEPGLNPFGPNNLAPGGGRGFGPGGGGSSANTSSSPANASPAVFSEVIPGAMEVRFRDGSMLKVKLKDKHVEFETPHGKLQIAVNDIHRIEVGVHASAEERKRLADALSDLGHAEAGRREAAAAELLRLQEKAYPALLQQTKSKDIAAASRAAAVLEKIRAKVPSDKLEASQSDVVYTVSQSKIVGRLRGESLRVATLAFGDVDVKFADVRDLNSVYAEKEVALALLGPGELQQKLRAACPKARDIRVSIADNGNLKVDVDVRAEEDVAPLMLLITTLPEMAPFERRREISFQMVTVVPVNLNPAPINGQVGP